MFRRQHQRGLIVAFALQLGQLGFRLLQFRLQFQRLAAQAVIRPAPQRFDALERPRKRRASAHADQRAGAAQVVENVGDQITVVGKGLRDALAEHLACLHPHVVHQQIRVGDDDDVGGRRRLRQVRDRRPGSGLLIRRRALGICGFHGSGDSRGQGIANAGGFESITERRRIHEGVKSLRRNRCRARRALQQSFKRGLGAGMRGQKADGRKIDLVERRRHDVLLIHVAVTQAEDADVTYGRRLHAGAHFESALQVADDLGRIVIDAPSCQQRYEIRGVVRHRAGERIGRILTARVPARVRVDEQQHPAAAHHELIDGVQGLRR